METDDKTKLNQKIALFRYELIIPVLNNTYPDKSALQYYKRIASEKYVYADGTVKEFSFETIKYWHRKYLEEGFDGLYPKTRNDKGNSRKLSKAVKEKIINLKETNYRMTATSIYIKLIEDGDILKKNVSFSTVARFVAKNCSHSTKCIEDMRAFEMQYANDLWQLDTTYCSYITDSDDKKHRTYLIMIIDDHSRMIVGFGFFLEDSAVNVQSVLKSAIKKYGIPKRLYADNGAPYKNTQLPLICAQLQIQILHTQIFHGNQKGKIERAFKSVKEQWMYNTDFSQFHSPDEINHAFAQYVNQKNNSVHAALNGLTPSKVFMNDCDRIRRIESQQLEQAFYHTVTRKVANDATIKLNTKLFEAGQKYIGLRVTVKYVPDLSQVYIFDDERYIEIRELNKVENSKIKRNKPLFAQEDEQ